MARTRKRLSLLVILPAALICLGLAVMHLAGKIGSVIAIFIFLAAIGVGAYVLARPNVERH